MQNFIYSFLDTAATAAATGEQAQADPLSSVIGLIFPIALMGLMAYFLLFRPQKKQEKTVREMRDSLRVGDEISTTGGMLGKIIQIKDDFIMLETGNDKTKIKIAKWAVRAVEKRIADEEEDDE